MQKDFVGVFVWWC